MRPQIVHEKFGLATIVCCCMLNTVFTQGCTCVLFTSFSTLKYTCNTSSHNLLLSCYACLLHYYIVLTPFQPWQVQQLKSWTQILHHSHITTAVVVTVVSTDVWTLKHLKYTYHEG